MSGELVKVVVTTYNRLDWARLAVDSVLAQTHREIHVVIVDDHSTDGTAELAQQYSDDYPGRVTAVCKAENRGIGDSIRVGLEAGPNAAYVAFLNDDDIWLPEKLERQVQMFRGDQELAIAFTDADIIDAGGERTGVTYGDRCGRYEAFDFAEIFLAARGCASTLIIRRDLAERAGPTFPNIRSWDLYLLLLGAANGRVAGLDQRLALYRETLGSMSSDVQHMNTDNARAQHYLFDLHPEVATRLSGEDPRESALMYLTLAIWPLSQRDWRSYRHDASMVIRQRQLRPTVWLVIHTVRNLLWPRYPRLSGACD